MCSELAILLYLLSEKTNDRSRGLDPNILARLFQGCSKQLLVGSSLKQNQDG